VCAHASFFVARPHPIFSDGLKAESRVAQCCAEMFFSSIRSYCYHYASLDLLCFFSSDAKDGAGTAFIHMNLARAETFSAVLFQPF
jgi:hypothetical protein